MNERSIKMTSKIKKKTKKITTSRKNPILANPENQQEMIAESAYFRSEKRGFVEGDPMEDWLAAEAEINTLFV